MGTSVSPWWEAPAFESAAPELTHEVGRCRLTVSKSMMKAPLVSALETVISQTALNVCFQFQLAPLQRGAHRRGLAA